MTDFFNFLGLPSVVQDLITNEIVHNSIPENRIQLALTSKYCNDLVQRAKPKKIVDQFMILYHPRFTLNANSREYHKTKEDLMEILPNCQIKQLVLEDVSVFSSEDYSEISDILSEATRFSTKLDIISPYSDVGDEVIGFYVKLKHLKFVALDNPDLMLPYYPSKVELRFSLGCSTKFFLEDLAKKSQNCPLSFFELECRVSFDQCQQFLQTAKFSSGAEISILNNFPLHLTYLGQNIFLFEMFSNDSVTILISQKFVGRNRRILKFKTLLYHPDIAFNVVSTSNPEKNYYSGVFDDIEHKMHFILENVDQNEILLVKFLNESIDDTDYFIHPRYTTKMLESAFPTANFTTPEERVKEINNVLGTNIQLIQADNIELFCKIQDSAS